MKWIKASEAKIYFGRKYLAKRSDDETIKGAGQFVPMDGTFFWSESGFVPVGFADRNILLVLDESESPSPVEVEAAAKKRYPHLKKTEDETYDEWERRCIDLDLKREGFKEGYNFRANHLGEDRKEVAIIEKTSYDEYVDKLYGGEDREGQDEWKQRFVNWFFAHKTYFPTPDKCADWFEKNVSVKDFVGDQDKLWRAVLDKVISDQILEHEEVPTDTINYLSNRYHLIKKKP